ncbi:hypothetical protein TNCV_1289041 [Trichonephila clavipes]|nr:hypothetical protein TNCV_1289041 [Trichonephila clavipes]
MKNGLHTTILCENDRGQDAVKQLERGQTRTNIQEGSTVYLLVTDQKRLELASRRGVVCHQDNATPHTSVVTRQRLWELGWKVSMHPPYSPPGTKRLPPFYRIAKLPE